MKIYIVYPTAAEDQELLSEVQDFIESFGHEIAETPFSADAMVVFASDDPVDPTREIFAYLLNAAIAYDTTPHVIVFYDTDTTIHHGLRQLISDNDSIVTVAYDDHTEILENLLTFLETI